jgi:hypothetical protein
VSCPFSPSFAPLAPTLSHSYVSTISFAARQKWALANPDWAKKINLEGVVVGPPLSLSEGHPRTSVLPRRERGSNADYPHSRMQSSKTFFLASRSSLRRWWRGCTFRQP